MSFELALAADIVIAAGDVRFRQLEIGRGIVPFGGATFRAPAQLGWSNAMRFLLTAGEFGAAEALRIGLVQEVVPAGAHVRRATELAQIIARQAPLGVQATLASARAGSAAARTRRASVSPRCCRASCAARTQPKGCKASSNGARHTSPATDQHGRPTAPPPGAYRCSAQTERTRNRPRRARPAEPTADAYRPGAPR